MVRSGVQEFRNNRDFMIVEHFEEFIDGTLIKKIVEDDSYGKKILEKKGMKLNLDKIENVQMHTDPTGYFKHYQDSEGLKYHSLQELIDANKKFLDWEYTNSTIDLIGKHKTISIKKGIDYANEQDWHFEKHLDASDKSEVVTNRAKDLDGEWKETWTKKLRERWANKEGYRNNADGHKSNEWTEKWYKKVKHRKSKKGEDDPQSDDSEIEESNCEKWGKNQESQEEWNEKWGEVHRPGERRKWCDKWQVDTSTGLKKGENWGQVYNEDYSVQEHWAEKWDDRHPENHGVYEKRHEFGDQCHQGA